MADVLLKDISATADSPASDDYIELGGTTNGSRKMLAGTLSPAQAQSALASRAPKQMLNCSGAQGRTTATLSSAIGTSTFDQTFTFTVPAVASAGAYGIFNISTTGDFGYARSFAAYIDAANKLVVTLFGANSATDARDATVANFRTTYSGQTINFRVKRTISTLVLEVNGQVLTYTDVPHGTAPAWTDTINGLVFDVGDAGQGAGAPFLGAIMLDYLALGNLSDAEYANYITTGGSLPSWCFPRVAAGTSMWSTAASDLTNGAARNNGLSTGSVGNLFWFTPTWTGGGSANLKLFYGGTNQPFVTTSSFTSGVPVLVKFTPTGFQVSAGWYVENNSGATLGNFVATAVSAGATAFFSDSGCGPTSWSGINGVTLTYDGVSVKPAIPVQGLYRIRTTTSTSGNQQLLGTSSVGVGDNYVRIRARALTGTPTITLGNVSGGNQLVTSIALAATWKQLAIVSGAEIATTANIWAASNSTDVIQWDIQMDKLF